MSNLRVAFVTLSAVLLTSPACSKTPDTSAEKTTPRPKPSGDVYGFELARIDGQALPLSDYRNKVLLVVNVASECGFTPQYAGLQRLHETFGKRGLVVMGVPANEFGGQEPGNNGEIQQFCSSKYGVTFPMFEKIVVKGPGQHPLYGFLTSAAGDVTWNFNKFLIGRDGKVIQRFESKVKPESTELVAAIETALGAKSS